VHGEAGHRVANFGELIRIADRTKEMQNSVRFGHALGVRGFELREAVDVFDPQRLELQDHFRQIQPPDFRRRVRRSVAMLALEPQPRRRARCGAAGAAGALVGGGLTDGLNREHVDPALGVVSIDTSHPAVDDVTNPFDGDGRFGDVRGYDDLAA